MDRKLQELDGRIRQLGQKSESYKDDAKAQAEQTLTALREQRNLVSGKFEEMKKASTERWNEAKASFFSAMGELEKANSNARQALMMQSQASQGRNHAKAAEYEAAAESIATRLIELEKSADDQKSMVLQATQAADQAKTAVEQNSIALQKKLAERQKLLSQLDQAKMQEQMNRAMTSLSASVGQDVPTLDEVRDKIEARYSRALGASELGTQTVETRMLEVEQAQINSEAQNRLDQIREQLGLPAAGEPAGLESGSSAALGTGATAEQKDDAGAPAAKPETPAPANPPGDATK